MQTTHSKWKKVTFGIIITAYLNYNLALNRPGQWYKTKLRHNVILDVTSYQLLEEYELVLYLCVNLYYVPQLPNYRKPAQWPTYIDWFFFCENSMEWGWGIGYVSFSQFWFRNLYFGCPALCIQAMKIFKKKFSNIILFRYLFQLTNS